MDCICADQDNVSAALTQGMFIGVNYGSPRSDGIFTHARKTFQDALVNLFRHPDIDEGAQKIKRMSKMIMLPSFAIGGGMLFYTICKLAGTYARMYLPRRTLPEPTARLDVTFGKICLPKVTVIDTDQHLKCWFWNGVFNWYWRVDCWFNHQAASILRLLHLVSNERHLWFIKGLNVRLMNSAYEDLRSLFIHRGNGFDYHKRPIMKRRLLDVEPIFAKVGGAHTHPEAASERNAMGPYFKRLAAMMGRDLFMYSLSNADIKADTRGNKTMYWPKDLLVPHTAALPKETDMIGVVDCDWYLDMNDLLTRYVVTWAIYGLNPTEPGGKVKNGDFTFINNVLHYSITGGANYKHELWDWNRETICASRYEDGEWYAAVYMVEQKTISDHRVVVLLEPIFKCKGLAAQLLIEQSHTPNAQMGRLVRMKPQPNPDVNYNIIECLKRTDDKAGGNVVRTVSVSPVGSRKSATVTAEVFAAMRATVLSSKQPITAAALGSHMGTGPNVRRDAEMFRLYFQQTEKDANPESLVISNENACKGYTFNPQHSIQEINSAAMKQKCKAVCSPFVGSPALTPMSSLASDQVGVANRITKLQHNTELKGDQFLYKVMGEFAELIVPEHKHHQLKPKYVEDVFVQQDRPSQRNTLHRGDNYGDYMRHDIIETFQKNEVYGKLADPRTISQVDPRTKLAYSMFYMVISEEILKPQPWYTFGKTPKEMAERVAYIATGADSVVMGDFSRMDATISNLGRHLTTSIMMRAFHPSYHEELQTLLQRQCHRTCFTRFGVKYTSGTSRLSGSPETSGHNTIENAFIAYLALRMTKDEDGNWIERDRAYRILCTRTEFGGDDSIMFSLGPGITEETYCKAASKMGLKATCQVLQRWDLGVNFLARFFSRHVWAGSPNSTCDIRRQATKLHTTTQMDGDPYDVLDRKMLSYALTDPNTPLIGDLATTWCRLRGIPLPTRALDPDLTRVKDVSWWAALYDKDVQFPNDNEVDNFHIDYLREAYPDIEYVAFREWLDDVKTPEEFMRSPPWTAIEEIKPHPDEDVLIIDGDDAYIIDSEKTVEEEKHGTSSLDVDSPKPVSVRNRPKRDPKHAQASNLGKQTKPPGRVVRAHTTKLPPSHGKTPTWKPVSLSGRVALGSRSFSGRGRRPPSNGQRPTAGKGRSAPGKVSDSA
ncbi:hypothetical protein 1 [Wenzhou bivalvia virus 3]|uniref:hypothetical protein 1 n=1 Tax=Wenzhou bivalvia virus 3 TaxID=1923555 RepID=UPI00090AF4A0|nr:hypothetical protein 1 [Wenzhou bivalvia virus 3]APG76099.1 hypothetical protein 1 [Wenzhou bivalvia virus 3]